MAARDEFLVAATAAQKIRKMAKLNAHLEARIKTGKPVHASLQRTTAGLFQRNRRTAVIGTHSRNGLYGLASLRLDVEGPDDVAPLLGFVGNEFSERGRCH